MNPANLSGRWSGRVEQENALHLDRAPNGAAIRDDSVASGTHQRPLTSTRLAALSERLTDLDWQIVGTLRLVRLASGDQLARLHFAADQSGRRRARRRLSLLVELKVLIRLGRRIGGVRAGSAGFVYCLDVVGQRLVGLEHPHAPWTPGQAFVAHLLAVTESYVQTVQLERAGSLELLEFAAEPQSWRVWSGPGGTKYVLKPDAYLEVGIGAFEDRWFLEVDRATEDLPRIARKAARYARYYLAAREDPFPRVLWLTTSPSRQAAMVKTLSRLPAEQWPLFQVAQAADFAAVILAGPGSGLKATAGSQA